MNEENDNSTNASPMRCPLCSNKLIDQHKGLSSCPNGHGTLVTGKYLSDVEQSPAFNEVVSDMPIASKHTIACPHCSQEMHKVNYNSTQIIIDACINCHYRWLDAHEITKIRNFKPNMQGKDLLFVLELDKKIEQVSNRKIKEANPRLPLQGSYRGGAEIVAGITGDQRTRVGAIVGQGLYGIVKGLTHSKASMILTITTLLIFGSLFVLLFWDYRDILRSLYQPR